jgi:hypothetical protein
VIKANTNVWWLLKIMVDYDKYLRQKKSALKYEQNAFGLPVIKI